MQGHQFGMPTDGFTINEYEWHMVVTDPPAQLAGEIRCVGQAEFTEGQTVLDEIGHGLETGWTPFTGIDFYARHACNCTWVKPTPERCPR